ncbi:hypothetical protein [Enterococcus sp. DIV0876]|uniref:hypothetical protein n=1 Tax=Enterococcus sp. DIV0876 TaxID=2774633 RepID=UPI003D301467
MDYTLDQEKTIQEWGQEKVRALNDELNDKKGYLSEKQRDQVERELEMCQELLYTNRLKRKLSNA